MVVNQDLICIVFYKDCLKPYHNKIYWILLSQKIYSIVLLIMLKLRESRGVVGGK